MSGFFTGRKVDQAKIDNETIYLNEKYKEKNSHLIIPADFETFWDLYPLKDETNKDEAIIEWNILCKKEARPTLTVIKKALIILKQKYPLTNRVCLAEFRFRSLANLVFFLKDNHWLQYLNTKEVNDLKANQTAYSELLKHPLWQRKRLEIMQRDDFKCTECGDEETTLNVHHKKYIPNKKPWEYEDDNLITLCENCHADIELSKKNNV